jgi:hypothetical protein
MDNHIRLSIDNLDLKVCYQQSNNLIWETTVLNSDIPICLDEIVSTTILKLLSKIT